MLPSPLLHVRAVACDALAALVAGSREAAEAARRLGAVPALLQLCDGADLRPVAPASRAPLALAAVLVGAGPAAREDLHGLGGVRILAAQVSGGVDASA